MNPAKLTSSRDLEELRKKLSKQRDGNKTVITICAGTGCLACGCEGVAAAFKTELSKANLEKEVEIKTTGCHGFCERGPLVVIQPQAIFYQRVKPADAKLVVEQSIKGGKVVNKLLYKDPRTGQVMQHEKDIDFYKKQMRLIFGENGFMDPTSIHDYFLLGGYQAMAKALTTITANSILWATSSASLLINRLSPPGGARFPSSRLCSIIPLISDLVNF